MPAELEDEGITDEEKAVTYVRFKNPGAGPARLAQAGEQAIPRGHFWQQFNRPPERMHYHGP
jgi:hypothetical protein